MSEKLTTLSQLRAVSQKSKDRAAQVADTAAAALDEMDEVKADKTEFVSFSIPATGWKTDSSVPGLLIRGRSTLALDTSKVDCDYYNFLRGSRSATNSYRGEYMTQYSWAEVTRSALRQQANVQKTASIPSYYVPPTGF